MVTVINVDSNIANMLMKQRNEIIKTSDNIAKINLFQYTEHILEYFVMTKINMLLISLRLSFIVC